jgi:U6 snRNA-associated Sm-like protein LSm4
MLVELKNGETLNGHLINCDTWMNLTLKEVVQTSPEGDKFVRLAEVYVRGNNVCEQSIIIVSKRRKEQHTRAFFMETRSDLVSPRYR